MRCLSLSHNAPQKHIMSAVYRFMLSSLLCLFCITIMNGVFPTCLSYFLFSWAKSGPVLGCLRVQKFFWSLYTRHTIGLLVQFLAGNKRTEEHWSYPGQAAVLLGYSGSMRLAAETQCTCSQQGQTEASELPPVNTSGNRLL